MGREELSRKLTGMAADVVRDCHVELALGWLWCNKDRDPLPDVPPDLFDTLMFVRDQGWREVDAAYTGRHYFEDCLRLALRIAPSAGVLTSLTNGTPYRGARRSQTVCAGAVSAPGLSVRPKAVIAPIEINAVPDCRVHASCLTL